MILKAFVVEDAIAQRLDLLVKLRQCSADDIVSEAVMRIKVPRYRLCERCGEPFYVRDRRMKFCTKLCTNRAQYERRLLRSPRPLDASAP